MQNIALESVFKIISRAAIAAEFDITPQAVWKWKKARVPAEYVLGLERLVNGRVTRHQLRPDLYPVEPAT